MTTIVAYEQAKQMDQQWYSTRIGMQRQDHMND